MIAIIRFAILLSRSAAVPDTKVSINTPPRLRAAARVKSISTSTGRWHPITNLC
jgi:hypothetical protein